MIKELPFVRINTDSRETLEKIRLQFDSITKKKFDIDYCIDGIASAIYDRNPDIEVLYACENHDFFKRNFTRFENCPIDKMIPVLVLYEQPPENLTKLSTISNLDYDILQMPIGVEFIQNKITQLLFLSKRHKDSNLSKKKVQQDLENANKEIVLINRNLEKKIKEALKDQEQQHQYIIQKSKLESLGELAAGIAHEINQPLGIMTLAFENLQLKFKNNDVTKEYLEQKINSIVGNIDRIRDIINHIRIFSREQDSYTMQKVNVNQVIHNIHKLIRTQYQNHNISIIYDLQENLGFTVGSKLKLEQVILNLLSNAKYAVDDYESIQNNEDYHKTIKIQTFFDSNRINILVQDNGIGIDPNEINKIFDPFYTTKPEWVGTGLGLSIIYGIINEMHGEIKVYSKQNEYTRFEISLPRFPEKD